MQTITQTISDRSTTYAGPARRRMVGALAAGAVALSTLTGLAGAPSAQAASSNTYEKKFIQSINTSRTIRHHRALSPDSHLNAVAQAWTRRMAASKKLQHNPRLTSDVGSFRVVGENVGVGSDVPGLHRAFMASAHHKANILNNDYTQVGVGVVISQGRMWVTEVFRKPVAAAKKAARSTSSPTSHAVIGYGSHGASVKRLQRVLHVQADGDFGPVTLRRLLAWQKQHHLKATGKLDTATRRAMHL